MTGTSVDGLDLAVIAIEGSDTREDTPQLVAARTVPLPSDLSGSLKALIAGAGGNEIERMGAADVMLGRYTAAAINAMLADCGMAPQSIRAIGSHGQTVRHRPDAAVPFTMQIGDGNTIAEATGITTVTDFRRRDLAAGGQAAPLVPPFHRALFGDQEELRVVANIGGIANISVLRHGKATTGHDTGPGNALLDHWYEKHHGAPYDPQGQWGVTGQVNQALLDRLMDDPFVQRSAPKSTGKEHYNGGWLETQLTEMALAPVDVQATLGAFTAACIAKDLPPDTGRVIVCGGGRLNASIMGELARRTQAVTTTSDAEGFDGDAVEAAAFAWLAHRRLMFQPGNAPTVTGSAGLRILGAVYAGATSQPPVEGA